MMFMFGIFRLFLIFALFEISIATTEHQDGLYYGHFPDDFAFGAATAAYQIEGAWNVSGKGPSIWDKLTHANPKMYHNQTGDVACDSYHKYKEDVKALKQMGATHYRFSLSWPRILPDGTKDNINSDGINYYKSLLKELKDNDIIPVVTLYHWDLPWAFYSMKGWTNESLVEYFVEYARICFREFGADVKYWVTINEPQVIMMRDPFFMYGYYLVTRPPKFVSHIQYQTARNLLLGHARVYHLYENEFKASQKGEVTIVLNSEWCEPYSQATPDLEAADRCMQFQLGLFAHPIYVNGDFPEVVKRLVANHSAAVNITSRLPVLTLKEQSLINATADYFGLNHYTTVLAEAKEMYTGNTTEQKYEADQNLVKKHRDSWLLTGAYGFRKVPWGIRKLLKYIHENYRAKIFVTENGCVVPGETSLEPPARLNDDFRVDFFKRYSNEILKAIRLDGVNVMGHLAWTLMDNFEWGEGYTTPFGVFYIDHSGNDPQLKRTAKASATFWKELTRKRGFVRASAERKTCLSKILAILLVIGSLQLHW